MLLCAVHAFVPNIYGSTSSLSSRLVMIPARKVEIHWLASHKRCSSVQYLKLLLLGLNIRVCKTIHLNHELMILFFLEYISMTTPIVFAFCIVLQQIIQFSFKITLLAKSSNLVQNCTYVIQIWWAKSPGDICMARKMGMISSESTSNAAIYTCLGRKCTKISRKIEKDTTYLVIDSNSRFG